LIHCGLLFFIGTGVLFLFFFSTTAPSLGGGLSKVNNFKQNLISATILNNTSHGGVLVCVMP
jgi:hypothetical protein